MMGAKDGETACCYDLIDATICDMSDTMLYRVGEGCIECDEMDASLRVEQRRDMEGEMFPVTGVLMDGGCLLP